MLLWPSALLLVDLSLVPLLLLLLLREHAVRVSELLLQRLAFFRLCAQMRLLLASRACSSLVPPRKGQMWKEQMIVRERMQLRRQVMMM